MKKVTDLSTLKESLTNREALVAAAVLPALPVDDVLVRIHDRGHYEHDDETRKFKSQSTTIQGTRLRRATVIPDNWDGADVGFAPSPHGTERYRVSEHDFTAFEVPEDADPDFDDTDQTFLHEFGVSPSPVDYVHVGVRIDAPHNRTSVFPD